MNQDVIWRYFQGEGVESFAQVGARTMFLIRQLSAGQRVLNIGVGSGYLERVATQNGIEIWCLDPVDSSILKLRQELGLGEKAQVGYCQDIPFPDAHFDTVVMSEVLEHLDEDTHRHAMREVWRVLRRPGHLIGTVPARENLAESMVVCPHCETRFHRWGHERSFTEATLAAAIGDDFHVIAKEIFFIDWENVGWVTRFKGLIKRFLSWKGIGTYGPARNILFRAEKV